MPPLESGESEPKETILEFVIREMLKREQIVDLLVSLGGNRQGNKDELAERLLAIRGLKIKEVLSKLPTDDLKIIVRRFDVPEPPKPKGFGGMLSSRASLILSDEKSQLVKRIEDFAVSQRPPGAVGKPGGGNLMNPVAPASTQRAEPPAPRDREAPAPQPEVVAPEHPAPPIPKSPPTPAPAGSPAGLPVFMETRDFVGSYKFAYQWDDEKFYEAELLGALRGRFGSNNAVRQQGESGRVYDIVVRNSARIEVKLPKAKSELDRMIGQVRRYISQHPGGVIVVIIGYQMRNQQEIHNAQEELESAGAVVFLK